MQIDSNNSTDDKPVRESVNSATRPPQNSEDSNSTQLINTSHETSHERVSLVMLCDTGQEWFHR